jgi:hypothetical protein
MAKYTEMKILDTDTADSSWGLRRSNGNAVK